MRSFLKLFAAILVVALATESFAQNFGIKAGLNLSNMVIKLDDAKQDDPKMNLGFNFGVTAEFPITDMISFETGLMLNTKGLNTDDKQTIFGETIEEKAKLNIFYLDIPLTAKVGFDADGAKIYALAGPYIGFGLSGKIKYEVTSLGITVNTTDDIEFGSNKGQSNRLDYGLLIGAGAEFGQITFGASYGHGIANMSNISDSNGTHRVVSISVGYKF